MSDATASTAAAAATPGSGAGPLATLAALVVKEGVGLGGLPAAQHVAALALAWSSLPRHAELRETEVNQALKRCLAEECRFLQTDHVELRRWLVDAGWLARDGFGREYQRIALDDLPVGFRPVAEALDALDPVAWVAGIRAELAAQRDARRLAWQARQAAICEDKTPERSAIAGGNERAGEPGRPTPDPTEPHGSGKGLP